MSSHIGPGEQKTQEAIKKYIEWLTKKLFKAQTFYGENIVMDVIQSKNWDAIVSMLELNLKEWKGIDFVWLGVGQCEKLNKHSGNLGNQKKPCKFSQDKRT